VDSILRAAGKTSALVGTIQYRVAGEIRPAPNTTPESLDLYRIFADLERRFDEALQKRRKANDDYCRAAATFELVKWKCERLRKQEEAFRTERRQWLAENRAKTSIKAVPTTSP
jgi:hypothetical protein